MGGDTRWPAEAAWAVAGELKDKLEPACKRIEVAGSLRRCQPDVGDIELVCIPKAGEFEPADAIHASPPCQGYSIMHNLPWLRGREYPLLILPTLELLEALGKPYVLENVMGARHGAKGLKKRGLEAHGLKAGWLCGWSFGRPFYRHRLFAANWLWLAPGHPKHILNLHPRSERWVYGGTMKGLPGDAAGLDVKPRLGGTSLQPPKRKGGTLPKSKDGPGGAGLTLRPGYEHVPFAMPTLTNWQNGNGAQEGAVAIGHARGWRLAAEAMGIDWMDRAELTQAIPPVYTEWVGAQLLRLITEDAS